MIYSIKKERANRNQRNQRNLQNSQNPQNPQNLQNLQNLRNPQNLQNPRNPRNRRNQRNQDEQEIELIQHQWGFEEEERPIYDQINAPPLPPPNQIRHLPSQLNERRRPNEPLRLNPQNTNSQSQVPPTYDTLSPHPPHNATTLQTSSEQATHRPPLPIPYENFKRPSVASYINTTGHSTIPSHGQTSNMPQVATNSASHYGNISAPPIPPRQDKLPSHSHIREDRTSSHFM